MGHLTTELQRAMLARMGIDVWVRRRPARPETVAPDGSPAYADSAAPGASPAPAEREARVRALVDPPPSPAKKAKAPERTDLQAPPAADSTDRAAATSRAQSPRVWTALAAGTVVFIGEIAAPQLRRLAQDIVLAAARFPQETVVAVAFEDAARSSDGGASSAVLAFVRGQLDRRRAQLLIVTGAAAPVLGLEAAEGGGEPRGTELYGVRCLEIGDLEQLRLRPEWKRNLWRALSRPR